MYTKQIDSTDVTTWELPEEAIGRLGQGELLDALRLKSGSGYMTQQH